MPDCLSLIAAPSPENPVPTMTTECSYRRRPELFCRVIGPPLTAIRRYHTVGYYE
ncbi:hypothetical protein GCM10027174_18800 [Salinifilum aidingensis]